MITAVKKNNVWSHLKQSTPQHDNLMVTAAHR